MTIKSPTLKERSNPPAAFDKEGLDAEELKDADVKSHLLHRVTLIVVEASLHSKDRYAVECSRDEVAFVSDGRGLWKMGDVGVRDDSRGFDFVGKCSKTAAERDGNLGFGGDKGAKVLRGLLVIF